MLRNPTKRKKDTGPDWDTVMAVLARDGFRCVRDGAPIQGERGVHWVVHHRRPRQMGGTRRADANSPANLLSLCSRCHEFVESERAEAYVNGWLVHTHHDPAKVPCLVEHGSRWVHLTDDGRYADGP